MLIAYICMWALGLSSNIMSLGGIAIAIGAMVDAAIVMIENAHKQLERAPPGKPRSEVLIEAAVEVGPALFFSLLIITVSFLPIFALEAQEGRLFKPLAYTKTFAMAAAALLSILLVPALMMLFVRGRIMPEHKNPVNRFLIWIYRPVIRLALKFKAATILIALAVLGVSLWPASRLGTEFMPNLNEGTLFYMPMTLPGISVTKAAELLQTQDKIIKSFPEVASVWGKAGRASTATDPAPTEMVETVINLKPESEWRPGMTVDKLIAEMDRSLQFPGVSNAWTMPIKARIDMLSTGIRTPVGVKVFGKDLAEMEKLARQIEAVIRDVPGTASAYAERAISGYYLNVDPDRAQLARYGLMVGDVQNVIAMALGAEPVTTTVEGRERYTVSIRYPRDYRSDPEDIATEVLIPLPNGGTVPLGEVAKVSLAQGPSSIRTENAQLALYIFVDLRDRDLGGYVADAQKAVAERVDFPPGYYVTWSGQFEYLERAKAALQVVVPVTMLIIFLLLYLNFRRVTETLIVMLSVPFALVGGFWLMWWLGFNLSVAVAVGFIALAGVAAETGVVMLIYLDHALKDLQEQRRREGRPFTGDDLYAAIMSGAVERVRPKMMTVAAIMAGLLPIMWSHGTGAEVMQRIAVPMIGGMVSSTVLTLIVIPAIYAVVKGWSLRRNAPRRRARRARDARGPPSPATPGHLEAREPPGNAQADMIAASQIGTDRRRALLDKLKAALVTPIRAMRLRYLPLLMIYYAYGALGLVTIAQAFWIKEALTFTPAELAAIAVWLTLPWTIKMVFGQLAELGAGPRLAAPRLCLHRREPRRLRARHSRRRRRRLDRLRQQERALCHRAAYDRHRRRAAGRRRRRHDHRGRRAQAARRHSASDAEIDRELGLVQVLGRLALWSGILSVAGLSGWLAQIFSYETVFLLGLIVPAISVTGATLVRLDGAAPKPIDWRILGGGLLFGAAVLAIGLGGLPFGQELIFVISLAVIGLMLARIAAGRRRDAPQAHLLRRAGDLPLPRQPRRGGGLSLVHHRRARLRRRLLRHAGADRRRP